MDQIIVNNSRKVSEYLGFQIKIEDNLLDIKECNSFVEQYKNYFETTDKEQMKEFFDKTGLRLAHIYESYDRLNSYEFNEMGSSLNSPLSDDIYNHHLLVITKVDELIIENNKIYADGKLIYDLSVDNNDKFEKEYNIRNYLSIYRDIPKQIDFLKKEHYLSYELDYKQIKQIFMNSFGDLYVLNYDGNLYCNNKQCEQDVECIWDLDSFTSYIIFKDARVEFLTSKYLPYDKQYDKVLYGNIFIAFLKNKILELSIIIDQPDTSIHHTYYGVDDISYQYLGDEYLDNEKLSLYVEGGKIDICVNDAFIETIR